MSFPSSAEALILGAAKFDFTADSEDTIYVRVRVDGDSKQEYENAIGNKSDTPSLGRLTVPGLGFPQLLGQGLHTFDFEVEVSATGTLVFGTTLTPIQFTLSIWEQRN